MKQLTMVHASQALVAPLTQLAAQVTPDLKVAHVVDDGLLAYIRSHGMDQSAARRACLSFEIAAESGADLIVATSASAAEAVDVARRLIKTPIMRIDEPMAEEAAAQGGRIALLATVESALGPTSRLLERAIAAADAKAELTLLHCEGALDALLAGRQSEHDRLVSEAVREAAEDHDVIVFAQASLHRLAAALSVQVEARLLSSPLLCLRRVAERLGVRVKDGSGSTQRP